jgi:hypothetical protein
MTERHYDDQWSEGPSVNSHVRKGVVENPITLIAPKVRHPWRPVGPRVKSSEPSPPLRTGLLTNGPSDLNPSDTYLSFLYMLAILAGVG